MIKAVSPWKSGEPCPVIGFQDFNSHLMKASFYNAGSISEIGAAKSSVSDAARVAIEQGWPYWAMERMFKEIQPLVAWDEFMQSYINLLYARSNDA